MKKYHLYGHFMHNNPSKIVRMNIEYDEALEDTLVECKNLLWRKKDFVIDDIKEVE